MRLFFAILFIAFGLSSCSKFAKVQKSTDYDYKLRMAEKYYASKKYNYAEQLYEELFPVMKGQPQFEDLFYKYAFCAYYLKDWLNAENLFKQFVEVFPTSPRAEEMDYMRAYCFYKQSPKWALDQTNTQKAIGLMQAFVNTHPNSPRLKEANAIIDQCRSKMELKEYKSAELYFNLGHYRASAIAFTSLMNEYPDSPKSDEYKLQVIKSYYLYAEHSYEHRQLERFEHVVAECNDFTDRFSESKLLKEVERYSALSNNNITNIKKAIQHEQNQASN